MVILAKWNTNPRKSVKTKANNKSDDNIIDTSSSILKYQANGYDE